MNNKNYKGIVFKIPIDSDENFGILVFSFEINGDWLEFIEVEGHDVSLYMKDCLREEDSKVIENIKTVRKLNHLQINRTPRNYSK